MDADNKIIELAKPVQPEIKADAADQQEAESNEHPIATAIDLFLHKCQDIKSSVAFVAVAAQLREKRFEKLLKDLEEGLTDRIGDACEIMKRIGKKGEMVKEDSYHNWPLFKSFRTNADFLKTYEEIYGRPFVTELQKKAEDKALSSVADVVASKPSSTPSEISSEPPHI